jgi:ABC-type glycerol-3-phosphate transport system permease component
MLIPQMACLCAALSAIPLSMAEAPGQDNTLYLLWSVNLLITAFGSAFLIRRMLAGVPRDLADAARIDGCGFWQVYRHVTVPLSRPALGLIGVLVLIAACDDALAPLIEAGGAPSPALYALHVSTRGIAMGAGMLGLVMAGVLLLIPPVMAIFFAGGRRLN